MFNSLRLIPVVLSLLLTSVHAIPVSNDTTAPGPGEGHDFDWESITATPKLIYHRCFTDYECAKLQVPLDWLSSEPNSANASIAIIKLASDPVEFPEYEKTWGGPVLTNPGGPGGSGVAFVLQSGKDIQKVVGKQFSIVGFDPRGVNNTRPLVSCFDNSRDRILWNVKRIDDLQNVGVAYVRAKLFGGYCTRGERGVEGKYLGTSSVARDMIAINDASWDLSKAGRRKGLQYWGFSYGSVLGITFATLFPKKVERMAIDGIVDVRDYFSLGGMTNLQDTEDVMDSFYTFCSQAGPLLCSFCPAGNGTTPNHIRKRLTSLLNSISTQPLALNITSNGNIIEGQSDLLTVSMLRYSIFQSLYAPIASFPVLSDYLVGVEQSIPSGVLAESFSGLELRSPLTCSTTDDDAFANEKLLSSEALPGIMCPDATPATNWTLSDYKAKLRILKAQSPTGAEIWGAAGLWCAGWNAQASWKPPAFKDLINSKPTGPQGAAPILLIGNTADPVTPLANAHSMAKLFPKDGAVVAVQEGEGHCSIAVPSECMTSLIGKYFATGKVSKNVHCARELAPFLGQVTKKSSKRTSEQIEAREAMKNIGRAMKRQFVPALGNAHLSVLLNHE